MDMDAVDITQNRSLPGAVHSIVVGSTPQLFLRSSIASGAPL
jgi:hypothetical protein